MPLWSFSLLLPGRQPVGTAPGEDGHRPPESHGLLVLLPRFGGRDLRDHRPDGDALHPAAERRSRLSCLRIHPRGGFNDLAVGAGLAHEDVAVLIMERR